MYDKNQYWFKYWTQYIINDVKDKCVNVPGVGINKYNNIILYIIIIINTTSILHIADTI